MINGRLFYWKQYNEGFMNDILGGFYAMWFMFKIICYFEAIVFLVIVVPMGLIMTCLGVVVSSSK